MYYTAALGSVPRSVKDPITTNDVNISGLNMLIACRDIKRFIFAAGSTEGDSNFLLKSKKNTIHYHLMRSQNMSMNFMRKYLMIYMDWNILD